ncbi:ewing's tumor-associated antigen 1 [Corythoichthys intestinalis]|uniref:ewing's tumor-associated antigen 1 n=1 Tax=Corythoichthys intestinalis TaxID=161448 RepID=UPI0025A63989|nr:ewing's tumor-associated antigen 1 [Corythoichthys intestinalis]
MKEDPRRPPLKERHEQAPSCSKSSRRLSRSFKLSQQQQQQHHQQQQNVSDKSDISDTPKFEFKTPTRPCSSRATAAFSGESPHDSDTHHDIVWDASSPSPQRLGKRAKKHAPGVVNISDIVSRIAPKHGRPEVSEPTLLKWIGDSAAIPCTPDVEPPKNRRKSPRSNGVDDLLKLARRFDLNLLHHEDEEEEKEGDMNPQSLQLQSQERLHNLASPPRHTEDDLDFLFDEPTQQASPMAADKSSALASADFSVNWEDNDLFDDSLLAEMTQNPENFCLPKHCSTQKTDLAVSATFADSQSKRSSTAETENTTKPDLTNICGLPSAVCIARKELASPSPTQKPVPAAYDFPEDDLDAIFLSDPFWDDPEDDEMLRELCEDVENRMGHEGATVEPCPGKYSHPCSLPERPAAQQFTFKRPGNPVSMVTSKPGCMVSNHPISMVTSKVVVKCSALEIERKKQQAMERRRRRLQEVQNIK